MNQMNRRQLLQTTGAMALFGSSALRAQGSGPVVKMIVPFTPGTTPDLCARLLGPKLATSLDRNFIVDNRAGASGMIGMDAVNKSAPDGSTLLFSTSTALTLPFVYAKVPFDVMTGFTPITMIGHTNFALAVHPSVPARNARELVAWIKGQSAPVDYASPGKGTFQHLCMEWIGFITGAKINHVPYKGSGPALADVLGGHVKMMVMPLHVAVPLAADGKLVVLGSTRRERDAAYPAVAPLAETGVANLDADAWYAIWGPPGMPKDLAVRYGAAVRTALADPEVKATLAKQGVSTEPGSPEELLRIAQAEHAKWGKLVKDIKLPQE